MCGSTILGLVSFSLFHSNAQARACVLWNVAPSSTCRCGRQRTSPGSAAARHRIGSGVAECSKLLTRRACRSPTTRTCASPRRAPCATASGTAPTAPTSSASSATTVRYCYCYKHTLRRRRRVARLRASVSLLLPACVSVHPQFLSYRALHL